MTKNEKTKKYEVIKYEDNEDVKKIKYVIKEVTNKLEELKKVVKDKDAKILTNKIIDLKRIEAEMLKGLYFVTIQGSLKTGKSTLTNLLIGEEIAITKSGNDTTRVPYVITKSKDNEARIVLYKLNHNTGVSDEENYEAEIDKKMKEILETIIDDIKGLNIVEHKSFVKREIDFDRDIIEKYTVEANTDDVTLINIQIPKPSNKENWILDHDIAILDTPGIEGEKANNSQQEIQEIRKRTNMLIVMQSTVTPINKFEVDELNKYKKIGNSDFGRLVHNEFELKSWATKEDKQKFKENEVESINNAKKKLKKIFGKLPFESLNLAKVNDYLKDSDTYFELKDEYEKFILFEKDIINNILSKRVEEKKKQSKENLKKFLENILKSDEEENLIKIRKKYEDVLEKFKNEINNFEETFEVFFERLNGIPDKILINKKDFIENNVFNIFYNGKNDLNIDLDKFIVNKVIDKTGIVGTDNYTIPKNTFSEVKDFIRDIQEQLNKCTYKLQDTFQEELNKELNIEELESFIKNNDYPIISLPKPELDINIFNEIVFNVTNDEIKNCIAVIAKYDEANLLIKKIKVGAEYSIKVIETQTNLIKALDKKLKQQKDSFMSSLKLNLRNYLNNYEKKLELIENEIKDKILQNQKRQIEQAENVVQVCFDIENQLRDLKRVVYE